MRKSLHFLALYSVLLTFAAAAVWAAPNYVDVTTSRQLDFVTEYGGTFPSSLISAQGTIIQRNLGNGAAVGDYDNDGDLDLYVLGQLGKSNALFRNDLDQGVFTNVTNAAAVNNIGLSRTAAFADLDNDGDLELILINDDDGSGSYQPSKIFRNDGNGSFTDVTPASAFEPVGYFRCGLAVADYNLDGLLDLYVTNWSMELGGGFGGLFPGYNRLYKNLGNLVFEDVTLTSGLGFLNRDSFSAVFKDFNADLYPDIFVVIDHSSDEFYWNQTTNFVNATATVGATHTGNDMGLAAADFDDDGDLDLYATNITDPSGSVGTTQFNVLSINQEAETSNVFFTNESIARGVEDSSWGWGTEFTDVENDGDLDILAVNGMDEWLGIYHPTSPIIGTPSVLFVNDSTGSFSTLSLPALNQPDDSRALITFDYDRDGDEDVLITNVNQPVRLLENVSDNQGHWLGITFRQTTPWANRDGIGATIYATVGAKTMRRDLMIGDSYLSGGPKEIILGVGPATKIDTLRVVWTDGTESTYGDLAVDRYVEIVQGFADADIDGRSDVTDCAPTDGSAWDVPSAVRNLTFEEDGALNWDEPLVPGGSAPLYDTLRSATRTFDSKSCVSTGSTATFYDDTSPVVGLSYYVVRVRNSCGTNDGNNTFGPRSTGGPCP